MSTAVANMASEAVPKNNAPDADHKVDDTLEMDGDAPSSPASHTDEKLGSGQKASKDRSCPFCGQAFTSSSLGRHLDLYIRPKNPKPPDGVHDVAEIRRLRAGITRRQPRTSGRRDGSESLEPTWHRKAREDSTPNSTDARRTVNRAAIASPHLQNLSPSDSPVPSKPAVTPIMAHFQTGWQATGVINDIPPRSSTREGENFSATRTPHAQTSTSQGSRRDGAGHKIEGTIEYEKDGMVKLQEQAEIGRAAEMALREVLGSLQAARQRLEPQELFPGIDFMTLSFPALCLAMLPAPTTIFTPTPFASLESWGLEPPGRNQFDNVSRLFKEQVLKKQKANQGPTASELFHYSAHLNSAYEQWSNLSEQDRSSMWTLELGRSYVKSQEQKKEVESQLDTAETRIRHLEAEYDRLSRCQLPRDFLMHPPRTLPASAGVMRELNASNTQTEAASMDYDADALLNKWRDVVRRTARKPIKYSSYPVELGTTYGEGYARLDRDMVANGAVFGVNGAFPRDSRPLDNSGVDYETPRSYGAVLGEEEDEPRTRAPGASTASQASPANEIRELSRGGVLSRLTRFPAEPASQLNANGKRPLGDAAQP